MISSSEIETTHPNTLPTQNDHLVVLNAGSQLYIKLDGGNYPAWRIQFNALLIGYDLQGYIDGSTPCPSKPLNNAPNVINPAYTHWVQQDQLILHAIVSSVTATVVTHLGAVRTSKQAWDTLKTMYAGRSRVRIMALKQRISTFTKGTQSMASYLQGIKAISDELSIIDSPLDNTDLVIHTFNGLGAKYREISAVLRARETPIDFAELHEKLMDFETLMHHDEPSGTDPILATAHAASRRHHQISFDNNSSMVNQQPKKKVICQFCEKPRHTAKDLRTGRTLLRRPLKQDLYHLPTTPSTASSPHALTTSIQPISTWHHKLGHPATKIIKQLADNHHIPIKLPPSAECSSCQCVKSHKHPFSDHSLTSNRPLELIYADVWGNAPFRSLDGFLYYVVFVDHYSKYVWLYPMKNKLDVLSIFIQFKSLVEKYFNLPIITLFSDNGGEFMKLRSFLSHNGSLISHRLLTHLN
ncbi:hypothetical protein L6164_033423 [Bauhinia variegata]|uniref:Uncharacterized protein n=1 Tax=Bauhinia variegata TaxID=167791 RepID=A0ACB9KS23_BAUVA|nr:hypothetical protein L6164_033423 [Bauhinia variegata]